MLKEQVNPNSLGVIVARFQINRLHEGHKELLEYVGSRHRNWLIVLGCSFVKHTKSNPLPFQPRLAAVLEAIDEINETKSNLDEHLTHPTIIYINDHISDIQWSKNLDNLIKEHLRPLQTACLYGSRSSFVENYYGSFKAIPLSPDKNISASELRDRIANEMPHNKDWRQGVIWSTYQRYPSVLPTVDIAPVYNDETVLLVHKNTEDNLWRFPGGFIEPKDSSAETAAVRELSEETNIALSSGIKDLEYLGTFQIDDWRFRSCEDKILTVFFMTHPYTEYFKAGDDVSAAKRFPIQTKNLDFIIPEHQPLFKRLQQYRGLLP